MVFHAGSLMLFLWMSVVSPLVMATDGPDRPLEVEVDMTEAPRKLLKSHLKIPTRPGPLKLHYPKWIQGEHAPSGPIADLAGLHLFAAGKPLQWERDEVDLYSFHCTVPDGVDTVEADLEYLAPAPREDGQGGSLTARLGFLHWHTLVLYPSGKPVRSIRCQASVRLPAGWKASSALPIERTEGGVIRYQSASLETVVDSPLLCGQHLQEIKLDTRESIPHFLVIASENPETLKLSDTLKEQHENLVREAGLLFGARHYRSYRFLLALSDHLHTDGIEHHECSENRVPERFLVDDSNRKLGNAYLLSHEFVHSWNGKYRRPEGLATVDFQQPLQTRMLWVYEGLTEYLGLVLAGRSGLFGDSLQQDNLASVAEWARNCKGRRWRSLEDTSISAPFLYGARTDWAHRRRGTDFYDEGILLWLEVDTRIRTLTANKKSLDDFCKSFFGKTDGPPEVKTYNHQQLLEALNSVAPFDWKAFFHQRVSMPGGPAPLEGMQLAGWKLTYQDTASEFTRARETEDGTIDLSSSIGLILKEKGAVVDVIPGSPADRSGIGPGMKLVLIGNQKWSTDRLQDAIAATAHQQELVLVMDNQDIQKAYPIDYSQGKRYPHLERIEGKPDLLTAILKPRQPGEKKPAARTEKH